MTPIRLDRLDLTNFRSIHGTISAPLDAQTILIHGENGAGKTSLLSAIELALRGAIEFLELADKEYDRQLLHRGTSDGQVILQTKGLADANRFEVQLSGAGISASPRLNRRLSDFFKERCYLPQALLNQLLKMYQDSDEGAHSPLSSFVSALLGLERLDAIEAGLAPVDDIRNLRKVSKHLASFEGEKNRVEREMKELRDRLGAIDTVVREALADLRDVLAAVGLTLGDSPTSAPLDRAALSNAADSTSLEETEGYQRQIQALRREQAGHEDSSAEEEVLAEQHHTSLAALDQWRATFDRDVREVVARVLEKLPQSTLPNDLGAFAGPALAELAVRAKNAANRSQQARLDVQRSATITEELAVARENLSTVDTELARSSDDGASLSAALAEISAHIVGDICPVCERDFAETSQGSLSAHVNRRIRTLSASAQRLLDLGSTKSTLQNRISNLEQEAAEIRARSLSPEVVTELDQEASALVRLTFELQQLLPAFAEGGRLTSEETAARRRLTELQSRNLARSAVLGTLRQLAAAIDAEPVKESDTVDATLDRLEDVLAKQAAALKARISARHRALEIMDRIDRERSSRSQVDVALKARQKELKGVQQALGRAAETRTAAQSVKSAVEVVRSRIIRREFNERLNSLWRDLFVRLAPSEPFVPAFKIPDSATRNLQPRLITQHRSGGVGGTPGAMLSAGNLNTAALTLFIALHLTMKPELPWLILDDPVQSMDDIHIAHFAALLRTLAKEHGRQVIVAVHDRQLFEYLRLELSPAFETDTLQTLELVRAADQDTFCLPQRYEFQEETALRAA